MYPGGNLLAMVYEDLPADELIISKHSGNKMFKNEMLMDDDMKKMLFGDDKLPKIALDE